MACDELNFPHSFLDESRCDDGSREDAGFVGKRPVLDHPLIEGMDDGRGRIWTVLEALLYQARERRVHDCLLDPELVEQPESGNRLAIRDRRFDSLAEDGTVGFSGRVTVPNV